MKEYNKSNTAENSGNNTFFQPTTIFPKLTVNAPNDRYEQQANAMADRVMRMEEGEEEMVARSTLDNGIQRMCANCEEGAQRMPLMRQAQGGGFTAPAGLSSQLQRSKGSGAPLSAATQKRMGQAFGTDFSGVRVHTGSQAQGMSQSIQAKAFTHGSDIYFNRGAYQPGSRAGDRLLAHELTHVVQQGAAAPAVQRAGPDDKKKDTPVETKVEVVTKHDFAQGKTKVKGTTTRSGEQKVSDKVTATAKEKISGDGVSASAGLKVKDKRSGLYAGAGVKATDSLTPGASATADPFIKVGGAWTPFGPDFLKLKLDNSLTLSSVKGPSFSADGKMIFLPNGLLSPELAAQAIADKKGFNADATARLSWHINEVLTLQGGVGVGYSTRKGEGLYVNGGVGAVIRF